MKGVFYQFLALFMLIAAVAVLKTTIFAQRDHLKNSLSPPLRPSWFKLYPYENYLEWWYACTVLFGGAYCVFFNITNGNQTWFILATFSGITMLQIHLGSMLILRFGTSS